jgi:Zn-dependent M16 (insulinase) family peptidase
VYIGVPVDIHHTARVFRGVAYSHPDHAALQVSYLPLLLCYYLLLLPDTVYFQVLGNVLRNAYLHREIREKGGAYGGGADSSGGQFAFYSYRDPNVTPTLQHFSDSIEWALNGKFTDDVRNHA